MPQVAKDYEQVATRLSLPPSFIDATTASLEHRRRREEFFDLFRGNEVAGDMLKAVNRPLQVIDPHALHAEAQATPESKKAAIARGLP
jgi:hypothetical protein